MKKLRVLDLFSGIGGFSLGLERTGGFETVLFCEIREFQSKVLKKHWPDVPIHPDIKTIEQVRHEDSIDVVCGGFPCQPFSTASRGRKVAEDLWPFMFRSIKHFKPKYVIGENVLEYPIAGACEELRSIGYKAHHFRISGNEIGADSQRDRWWAVAYPNDKSELYGAVHAEVAKLQKLRESIWGAENYARTIRVPDGIPNRMDRLESLGNTIFPQIPEALGLAILKSHYTQ